MQGNSTIPRVYKLAHNPNPFYFSADRATGRVIAPAGKYVHVAIDGTDYRVYFEEAEDTPLLSQHTTGCAQGGRFPASRPHNRPVRPRGPPHQLKE